MDLSAAQAAGHEVGSAGDVQRLLTRLAAAAFPDPIGGSLIQRITLAWIASSGVEDVSGITYKQHAVHKAQVGEYISGAAAKCDQLAASLECHGGKLANMMAALQESGWIFVAGHDKAGHPQYIAAEVPKLLACLPQLGMLPGPGGASPLPEPVSPPAPTVAVASQLAGLAISEPSGITIRVAKGSLVGVNSAAPELKQVRYGLECNLKRQLAGKVVVVACQCRDNYGLSMMFSARISPLRGFFDLHWCSCRGHSADQVPTICAGLPSAARPFSPEWRRIHPASS